ncbi:SLC13 family permease [Corynebacterium frankenforstense]
MTLVPLVGALVTGHGPGDIGGFFAEGLDSVMNVVVMFIFAIIFFGILQDVGLFTPVIKALIRATRGNVVAVTTGTAAIGIVAHLDGSGSTTFLLTIPALLPLYRALGISRYILITIVALAASVMNMVPWAGPLGRAGAVIAQEPSDIWLRLLPIQGVAVVLVLVVAAGLGLQRRRRIAARGAAAADVEASRPSRTRSAARRATATAPARPAPSLTSPSCSSPSCRQPRPSSSPPPWRC